MTQKENAQPRNAELGAPSNGVNATTGLGLESLQGHGVVTMTSLELVDFINEQRAVGEAELRHDHFMVKVPKVLGEFHAPKFLGTQTYGNNNTRAIYNMPKREACLMAMSYSYELQAKVFDRMTALEQSGQTSILPNFADPVAAARAWADAMESGQKAVTKLALAAPKVAFVDRYVEATSGSMGLREVCKVLGAKQTEFTAFLLGRGLMYRTTPQGSLTPRAEHVHAGRFEAKTGTAEHGDSSHAYVQYKFTAKGMEWVAGLWAQLKAAKQSKEV